MSEKPLDESLELLQHVAWIDDTQQAMTDRVIELCNVNSSTMNVAGIDRVQEMLEATFREIGGEVDYADTAPWVSTDDDGTRNEHALGRILHVVKRPDAKKQVMLCIHADTVYGVDHAFQECRMTEGGQLNGPGVADAKGGLVVMMQALTALERSPLAEKIGWEVIVNPDEEIGSPGSDPFLRSRASKCDFGLLFEPALPGGVLVSSRKGSGNFTFTVTGKAAHSGRDFAAGRNAIVALARLLNELDRFNTEPDVTYNVGRISGGGATNIVPDLAVAHVNVRVVDLEQQSGVEIDFADLVEKYNQIDGITVTMNGGFSSPPKPWEKNVQPLQQRIEACGALLGLNITWEATGGACDGNKFADAGLPNIDTMGPCGGNLHSEREFLVPDSLVERAKLAALVLMRYASE